jgi:hypothetical protein
MNPDLRLPSDISLATAAHRTICTFLRRRKLTFTGGCRAFYSPEEWRGLGHSCGPGALLVVCHDGGSVGDAFSYDNGRYKLIEAMARELAKIGVFAEQATTTHTVIFPITTA